LLNYEINTTSKKKKQKTIINTHQQIIDKLFEYLDFLQTPNPTFNNMPICPFIAGDLQTGNIKFMVYTSDMDKSLIEVIKEWKESDFKTGLILHVGDDMKNIKRRKYQKFINEQMKENGMKDIKLLMFSPFEDFKVAGLETRKKAPCVLYNLAKKKDLYESSKKLKKTKWYDNFLTEDFKQLGIKKHKKLLWFLLIINIYIWITQYTVYPFYGV